MLIFISSAGWAFYSFASAVYATANPSVRLSVRHIPYCIKTRERIGMLSSPSGVSSFLVPRMVDGDGPVHVKFKCKEVDPRENSRAVHILPDNSGNVIDSETKFNWDEYKVDHGLSNEPTTKVMRPP